MSTSNCSLHEKRPTLLPFRWMKWFIPLLFLFGFTPNFAQVIDADAEVVSICELEVVLESMTFSCDGTDVCINILNGEAPFTITLNGPTPTPDNTNLSLCFFDLEPGSYTITVTDAEGCTASLDVDIPVIDYFIDAHVTDVSSHGGNDGAIQPIILIDIAPLFFSWEGPNGFTADTESIHDLEAGIYSVSVSTVDDICVGIGSWEVHEPDPIVIETELEYPVCGQPDGCLFVSGGTAPYHIWVLTSLPDELANDPSGPLPPLVDLDPSQGFPYNPMNSDTAACGSNLAAGTFFILVVDSHLCYAWETLIIDDNPVHFTREVNTTDVGCHGGNDGSICFRISGGEPPYGTTLSPNSSNIGIVGDDGCFENLPAGTYTLTTTDATGCTLSETFTIGQPAPLHAEFEITNNGCNGQVDGCLRVSGGTVPYQIYVFTHPDPTIDGIDVEFDSDGIPVIEDGEIIDWFDLEPGTTPNFEQCAEDIPPGNYLIVVVDANWCYVLLPVVIPDGNNLNVSFEITSDICDDQVDGCLTIEGGIQPYRIWVWTWDGSTTGDPLPDVLFDANSQPYFDEENIDPSDVWPTDPNEPFVRCVEDIPAGFYLVLVMDAQGCYDLISIYIPEPNPLRAHFEITSSDCDDGVDGCLIIDGGTQPYHVFVWTPHDNNTDVNPDVTFDDNGNPSIDNADPNVDISFDNTAGDPYIRCAENIPPGRYYILVVDANLCYVLLHVIIPDIDALEAVFEITSDECDDGVDGCLTVTGGTQPYQIFVWTPHDISVTDYDVTFDNNGNPDIDNADPTDVMPFDPDPNDPFVRCAENIPPGHYLVLVVDANGCYVLLHVFIPEVHGLDASFEITSDICDDQVDGCLTISGGTQPYQIFVWTGPAITDANVEVTFDDNGNPYIENADPTDVMPFDPDPTDPFVRCAEDIPPGHYLVLVVDANQCYVLLHVFIPIPNPLHAEFEITNEHCGDVDGCLKVEGGTQPYRIFVWTHPDPTHDHYDVTIADDGTPSIDGANPTDVQFHPYPDTTPNDPFVRCAENIPPGFYLILVLDANNCYVLLPVHIPDGEGLTLETEVQDVSCFGNEDGAITLTISGGIPPYTIVFDGESNNPTDNSLTVTFFNLAAGVYSITVYDAQQCSASVIVVVGSPDPIQSNLEFDTYGEFACVDPSGGTEPYLVSWFDFSQNVEFSQEFCVYDLEPGAYWVSILDANACGTDDILIIDPFVCSGGEASVDPEVIESGESTTFTLSNYGASSIQWQFKTEFTDWLNIPGATEDTYHTPPIHTGTDKEILVRAQVICPDGDVLYSTEAVLTVMASNLLLPIAAMVEDPNLFNPAFRKAELANIRMLAEGHSVSTTVYPTITRDEIKVRYEYNTTMAVTISVVNQLGSLVYEEKLSAVNKGQITSLSAQNWGSGAYFIRLESANGVETHRVIVQ